MSFQLHARLSGDIANAEDRCPAGLVTKRTGANVKAETTSLARPNFLHYTSHFSS
jgi:hypothetical protein